VYLFYLNNINEKTGKLGFNICSIESLPETVLKLKYRSKN